MVAGSGGSVTHYTRGHPRPASVAAQTWGVEARDALTSDPTLRGSLTAARSDRYT